METIERHSEHFYIRANRCASLYDSLLALRGWKNEEINGIEYELNSITVEKWEGKAYRLVIQRERRTDGERRLVKDSVTEKISVARCEGGMKNSEIQKFKNSHHKKSWGCITHPQPS